MSLLRPKGSPTKLWHESDSLQQLPHRFSLDTKGLQNPEISACRNLLPASILCSLSLCFTYVANPGMWGCWHRLCVLLEKQHMLCSWHTSSKWEMPQAGSMWVHGESSSSLALLPPYSRQLQHLVLHQGDKRADDNSCVSSVNWRKLVAQALSVAWEGKKRKKKQKWNIMFSVQLPQTILTPWWAQKTKPCLFYHSPPKKGTTYCFLGCNGNSPVAMTTRLSLLSSKRELITFHWTLEIKQRGIVEFCHQR